MTYSREIQVGLALVTAAVIFFVGVRYFADQPLFGGSYVLYTSFPDAGGVAPGNAVFINGVKVGTVEQVTLDVEADAVRVAFAMEGDVRVPEGSRTAVSGLSFLGTTSMSVRLGPATNPPVEPGSFLPSAAQGGMDDLAARAPALAARADTLLLNADLTLEAVGRELVEPGSDVRRTLAALRAAAVRLDGTLAAEQGTLRRTLANLEAFSQGLAEVSEGDSLARTVARLDGVLRRLDANLAQLETGTARLDRILVKVEEGDGTLALLLDDPSLYHHLDSTARNLNRLITEFQQDPERYLQHLDLIEVF